ncbi:16S rRNA (cytidine(1402)-2'-O)-methyltransferase [Candidatus Parcubacteria bacterium]|nr:16S rRNA (cytidine(1402)-2'-O)-methyltransferase [Candidatus Parcubacteria bacterium]
MLYIVATPIGNLADITLRALEVLKSVDYILCEDTRVTRKLLDRYEIKNKKLESYHQHSNDKKIKQLIELIKKYDVAFVTDAGTPGISDPGNKLISELVNTVPSNSGSEIKIVPIPGASAITTALSISGLPTDNFLFLGFAPHKKHRQKFLQQVLDEKRTVVFYESKYRIIKTLTSLNTLIHTDVNTDSHRCAGKSFVVCRELTKKFETIYRGNINEVLEQIKNDVVKGEYVVISGMSS